MAPGHTLLQLPQSIHAIVHSTYPKVGAHVEDFVLACITQLGVQPEIADTPLNHGVNLLTAARGQLLTVLLQAVLGTGVARLNILAELHPTA